MPNPPRPTTTLDARTAELKAKLLMQRASRTTTPAPDTAARAGSLLNGARVESSLRENTTIAENTSQKQDEGAIDLDGLISQFSEKKPLAEASVTKENMESSPLAQRSNHTMPLPKQHLLSSESYTKTNQPINNGKQTEFESNATHQLSRDHTKRSESETSEGEIVENSTIIEKKPLTKSKGAEVKANALKENEKLAGRPQIEQPATWESQEAPRRPQAQVQSQPSFPQVTTQQRSRDDRHEEDDARSYRPDYKDERRTYDELERSNRPSFSRRESLSSEQRRQESKAEQIQPETRSISTQSPKWLNKQRHQPTLANVLPHDADLKEWLDITGFHNVPYRSKILNRRRQIAALDAQREQLLAEMAAEERGGLPNLGASQNQSSTMLPPPIPNKTATPPETLAANGFKERDRSVSNKRAHSEVEDARDENGAGKMSRLEDRIPNRRLREDEDIDMHPSWSSGFDPSRRSSRDELEPARRPDGRIRSPRRDMSPDYSRGRGRYEEPDSFYDREDQYGRGYPSRGRGGYQGRSYDPGFSRGRGRGRGRGSPDPRDKLETSFGSRIANGRPFRDPKGFDRGGKGGR